MRVKLNRENEPYKTVQLSHLDTIVEIIPEVLRKYKIEDDWQNYALILRDRVANVERPLSTDEKPLCILQENRNARFVLKHLKSRPHRAPTRGATANLPVVEPGSPSGGTPTVAVYEYNAAAPDELSVTIGDRFVVFSQHEGWCIATKDGKTGWVPSGTLRKVDPDDELPSPLQTKSGTRFGGPPLSA
ncbi:Adaptor for signal transduction [Thoreauomyces humboldtii]|nr:Adaptor for signal transduction [Thoreauomyces humboldtii]